MKKVTISGVIKSVWPDSFKSIKLVQKDGYMIDLVGRAKEASESYIGYSVQVSYYLSDEVCTKNEMVEGWLKTISGAIEADYKTSSYRYSSWTHGTDYDTILNIGRHDLFSELNGQEGMFVIIEFNFKKQ